MVEMLGDLEPLYFGGNRIRLTPQGGWTHPWAKVDALRNYLLLTCFEVLGGRSQFLDFQSWLCAARSTEERVAAISTLSADAPAFAVAAALHKAYLSQHGGTQAFFRFLHEVLPC